MSTWKNFERRIAKSLGGRRIPVTGIDRDGADVVTPLFHVQCKRRKGVPSYIRDWLSGICGGAGNKVGIVVWQEPGGRDRDALVVMRYRDFEDLHGGKPAEQCACGHEKEGHDFFIGCQEEHCPCAAYYRKV